MQENRDNELYYNATKPDFAAVVAAVVLTLLIHALVFWAIPAKFEPVKSRAKIEELKLEILPPKINKAKPEYVEANPYANNQTPDAKAPESFQNQRAADEIIDPTSKSKKPFVQGDSKDSNKIVSGTNSKEDAMSPESVMEVLKRPLAQQSPTGTADTSAEENKSAQMQAQTQTQGSKSDEQQQKKASQTQAEEKKKSLETNVEKLDGNKTSVAQVDKSPIDSAAAMHAEKVSSLDNSDGASATEQVAKNIKADQTQKKSEKSPTQEIAQEKTGVETPQSSPENAPKELQLPKPQKRKMLSMRIPPGPLADNNKRASMLGTLAVDSRFSEFGAYMQRMIEAVSRQWNLLASNYDLASAIGTYVIIEYYLNPHGDLVRINVLYSNSNKIASSLCEQSILTTAPYGEWSQEMVDTLGNQDQSVKITFHYR